MSGARFNKIMDVLGVPKDLDQQLIEDLKQSYARQPITSPDEPVYLGKPSLALDQPNEIQPNIERLEPNPAISDMTVDDVLRQIRLNKLKQGL